MAYNQNIPQPTDRISVSQPQILANFLSIFNAFNLNHVPFNAPGEGKHAFLEMPVQNPVPVTGAGEVGIYCRTSPITATPQLVFQRPSNGTVIEFTSAGPNITSQLMIGWARLPSGVLLKWGSATGSGAVTVTFPVVDINGNTPPVFTQTPLAFVSPTDLSGSGNVAVTITGTNTTQLGVICSQRTTTTNTNTTFWYFVIGI